MQSNRMGHPIAAAIALATASCVGAIGDPSEGGATAGRGSGDRTSGVGPGEQLGTGNAPGSPGTTSPGTTAGPGQTPGNGSAPPAPVRLAWPVDYRGTPSSLRRLSRDELVASAQLLTGIALSRRDLPDEPRVGHGALRTSGMSFLATEVVKVKSVLADFATRAAPSLLTKSGCVAQQQGQRDCLLTFTVALVEQGWRRPLEAAEKARFAKLLDPAGASREDDLLAVEGVLQALFFSPSFLYRSEIGAPVPGRPGLRVLTAYELASRLSFLATLAPPDAELLAAAKANRLVSPAERIGHFERLAKTDLGKRALAVMVLEWLGAGESRVLEKSSKYLTGLGPDFEMAIRTSAEAAVRKTLEGPEPTVGALLSTDAYLTDPQVMKVRLAAGSGKTASGDPDGTTRLGLLMHPHVLASHTKEDGASPFQIGLFLRQTLLCQPVPAPPAGAAASAKTDPPPGLTTRQDLEYRTNVGGACQACHQLFSPLGFAFLPFDPVGRWVKQDPSGQPWDLAGSVETHAGATLAFKTPSELMRALAGSAQVQGCFAQAVLEWVLGRGLVMEDTDLLLAADEAARRTRGALPALLTALVASPGFVNAVAAR